MPELMTENVYERALEELERRGHCRGTLESADGQVCLLGAIAAATGELNDVVTLTGSRAHVVADWLTRRVLLARGYFRALVPIAGDDPRFALPTVQMLTSWNDGVRAGCHPGHSLEPAEHTVREVLKLGAEELELARARGEADLP